jgi:hypothetical protein
MFCGLSEKTLKWDDCHQIATESQTCLIYSPALAGGARGVAEILFALCLRRSMAD